MTVKELRDFLNTKHHSKRVVIIPSNDQPEMCQLLVINSDSQPDYIYVPKSEIMRKL